MGRTIVDDHAREKHDVEDRQCLLQEQRKVADDPGVVEPRGVAQDQDGTRPQTEIVRGLAFEHPPHLRNEARLSQDTDEYHVCFEFGRCNRQWASTLRPSRPVTVPARR